MSSDALQRPLDAAGNQINNVGTPSSSTDATQVTSTAADIKRIATSISLGSSFLAAPADHAHKLDEDTVNQVVNVDIAQLQRNFRYLLRAYVTIGFPLPPELSDEFALSVNQ